MNKLETNILCNYFNRYIMILVDYINELEPSEEHQKIRIIINKNINTYPSCLIESFLKICKGYFVNYGVQKFFDKDEGFVVYIDLCIKNKTIMTNNVDNNMMMILIIYKYYWNTLIDMNKEQIMEYIKLLNRIANCYDKHFNRIS